MNIKQRFENMDEDYLHFEKIENKRNQRPDLHAWLLLDELFPNPGENMVDEAVHDVIWLDVEGKKLNQLSDKQIRELVRCGVMYDSDVDSLSMYI